jgi:hypothetical protein
MSQCNIIYSAGGGGRGFNGATSGTGGDGQVNFLGFAQLCSLSYTSPQLWLWRSFNSNGFSATAIGAYSSSTLWFF